MNKILIKWLGTSITLLIKLFHQFNSLKEGLGPVDVWDTGGKCATTQRE